MLKRISTRRRNLKRQLDGVWFLTEKTSMQNMIEATRKIFLYKRMRALGVRLQIEQAQC